MALENEDIEKIGYILSLKLNETMKPIEETMQKFGFILTGPEGKNGLVGDNKRHEERLDNIEKDITKFKAYMLAASGAVSTAIVVAKEVVSNIIKH